MSRVVLFEMNSQDPERQRRFWAEAFGWSFGPDNWGYTAAVTGTADQPGIDGGISKGPSDYPHGTRVVLEVEAIDEAVAQAVAAGAQLLRAPMEFNSIRLAYLVDPTGIGFGLIQYL